MPATTAAYEAKRSMCVFRQSCWAWPRGSLNPSRQGGAYSTMVFAVTPGTNRQISVGRRMRRKKFRAILLLATLA
jgi:hypothetical protein